MLFPLNVDYLDFVPGTELRDKKVVLIEEAKIEKP